MPLVQVGLDKWLEGQTTGPTIVTRIRPVRKKGTKPVPPITMMIPAGKGATRSVDLRPGRYLFEAYLPSGEVTTLTATVKARGNAPIVLQAPDSPHEWLSWQHLAGQGRPSPPRAAGPADGVGIAPAPPLAGPTDLEIVSLPVPILPALVEGWRSKTAAKLPWVPRPLPARANGGAALVDDGLTSYLFGPGAWALGDRAYALVRRPPAGPPLLAVLPLPWSQADMSGDAPADVLVDARAALEGETREWPVTMSIVVRDNVMGPVIGYLTGGDLPAAARIVETAVDLLYGKVANPLAAAAGAYVLVRAHAQGKRPQWEPWLRNLRQWFTWLPDGSILDGWASLRGIGRPQDVPAAAASFVEAVTRGLPFYSVGVRMLFDGLSRADGELQAGQRPPGFDTALATVRMLALRVHVGQPFTLIRLG